MSKAICYFAPGLEECEGLVTVDLLRRAGVEVTIAAVSPSTEITGAHGICVRCLRRRRSQAPMASACGATRWRTVSTQGHMTL